MDAILEKKDFRLFFHNKESDITLPVGWTGTLKGMLTKCRKLLRDNEGSHFEMVFDNGPNIELTLETMMKIVEQAYAVTMTDPITKTVSSSGTVHLVSPKEPDAEPKIGNEEKPAIPEAAKHVVMPRAEPGYLFCSSKKCNHQIKIKGNLEYKHGNTIYLVCPECNHKTKVSKVERTNSLSYAVGSENKGTLIRPDGTKKHMSKKARLQLKQRTN
jgi:hypothetical protein